MSDKLNISDQDNIKISIPTKPEYVSVVRLTTSSIANRVGFNIEEIDDVKVAIAEACTFMLGHNKESEEISIDYLLSNSGITITVKSCTKDSDVEVEQGLGLFIIKSLMDSVEFNNNKDGIELKMIKKIEDVAE